MEWPSLQESWKWVGGIAGLGALLRFARKGPSWFVRVIFANVALARKDYEIRELTRAKDAEIRALNAANERLERLFDQAVKNSRGSSEPSLPLGSDTTTLSRRPKPSTISSKRRSAGTKSPSDSGE